MGNNMIMKPFGSGFEFGNFTGAIIIDEPLRENLASSEEERQKINEWIGNTFRDRLDSGVSPVVINKEKEK